MVVWALLVVVMVAFLIRLVFDSPILELVEEAFLVMWPLSSLVVELLVA